MWRFAKWLDNLWACKLQQFSQHPNLNDHIFHSLEKSSTFRWLVCNTYHPLLESDLAWHWHTVNAHIAGPWQYTINHISFSTKMSLRISKHHLVCHFQGLPIFIRHKGCGAQQCIQDTKDNETPQREAPPSHHTTLQLSVILLLSITLRLTTVLLLWRVIILHQQRIPGSSPSSAMECLPLHLAGVRCSHVYWVTLPPVEQINAVTLSLYSTSMHSLTGTVCVCKSMNTEQESTH